jgi:hypothetical protein
MDDPTKLPPIAMEPSRRVAAADWVAGIGGVVVLSGRSQDLFTDQELFLVESSGALQPLPVPWSLRAPISDVLLVPREEPLLIFEEWWGTGADLTPSWLAPWRGRPYHRDLVVTDLAGRQRARHRSAHRALLSPDSRSLAYWRSNQNGLHNLLLARPEEEPAAFVAAITEVDPGSGPSFSACWSADSRYLHVAGAARGPTSVRWTYDLVAGELYQLNGGGPPR